MKTTAKAYGIKVRYYGEHVGEHNGNQGKWKKNPSPLPPSKGRNARHLECICLGLPLGCMKFLFPKELRRTHCKEHPYLLLFTF
jgi:hypothetical protein